LESEIESSSTRGIKHRLEMSDMVMGQSVSELSTFDVDLRRGRVSMAQCMPVVFVSPAKMIFFSAEKNAENDWLYGGSGSF
jgi:hypothetical protein